MSNTTPVTGRAMRRTLPETANQMTNIVSVSKVSVDWFVNQNARTHVVSSPAKD